jgi:hypothetical protein
MAPPNQSESPARNAAARVQLQPIRFHHMLFDGSWQPNSTDLNAELRVLVPVLDDARGPVKRLLLSPAGWTTRPHLVIAAGRTVSVGYLAGQSPTIMTVLCADGGIVTIRVRHPGPAPGVPGTSERVPDVDDPDADALLDLAQRDD